MQVYILHHFNGNFCGLIIPIHKCTKVPFGPSRCILISTCGRAVGGTCLFGKGSCILHGALSNAAHMLGRMSAGKQPTKCKLMKTASKSWQSPAWHDYYHLCWMLNSGRARRNCLCMWPQLPKYCYAHIIILQSAYYASYSSKELCMLWGAGVDGKILFTNVKKPNCTSFLSINALITLLCCIKTLQGQYSKLRISTLSLETFKHFADFLQFLSKKNWTFLH